MQRKELIAKCVMAAGKIMLSAQGNLQIQEKSKHNIVTKVDYASEKAILDLIKIYFPQDKILSEESHPDTQDLLLQENLWIIDPIDGTNNFASDRAYSCVSVAYAEKGIVTLAAIYDPFRDELIYAEKGHGAFCNEVQIHVNSTTDLAQAAVATDNDYDPKKTYYNVETVLHLKPLPWIMMRGSAALALADVACGRADIYLHSGLAPWDSAAGYLLVLEAGGIVKNQQGEEYTFLSPDIIAGNAALVAVILEQI